MNSVAGHKCAGCGRKIHCFTDDWPGCPACGCVTAEVVRERPAPDTSTDPVHPLIGYLPAPIDFGTEDYRNGYNDALKVCMDQLRYGLAQQAGACDMGALCIGCEPRNADGSCPDQQPATPEGMVPALREFFDASMAHNATGPSQRRLDAARENVKAMLAAAQPGKENGHG